MPCQNVRPGEPRDRVKLFARPPVKMHRVGRGEAPHRPVARDVEVRELLVHAVRGRDDALDDVEDDARRSARRRRRAPEEVEVARGLAARGAERVLLRGQSRELGHAAEHERGLAGGEAKALAWSRRSFGGGPSL